MKIQEKIEKQQRLAQLIRDTQAEERAVRAEILEQCFGVDVIGTQKTQVDNLIITGKYGLNYKFNQVELDDAISKGTLSSEALDAINVKYELSKKVYDALDDSVVEELAEFLTISPSLPTIEIKAAE